MAEPDLVEARAAYRLDHWRECPDCGLVSALPDMEPGLVAECPRCRKTLWRMLRAPFSFPIACGMAATLFYAFALVAPFLEISAYGRFQLARLETGPDNLMSQGYLALGMLVLAVTAVFPGVKLGIMLTTLIGLETGFVPPRVSIALFRLYHRITPWSMIDVYLLGFLVAYTRLIAIAHVHLDTSLYALIGLMVSMAAADGALDREAVWRALERNDLAADARYIRRHPTAKVGPTPGEQELAEPQVIGCHTCHLVNHAAPGDHCRRCDGLLHPRKHDSTARTWAFLLAALCLYIPANIYPVMIITQIGQTQSFTIMGGIKELIDYGLLPLAALVFVASITIPLAKLITLAFLLIQTQRGRTTQLNGRTRAFRIIDFIGRWSMIDIFMISILVALVRFDQFAQITAQVGAPCFAGVVVLTMFAVMTFDPRTMWDATRGQAAAYPTAGMPAAGPPTPASPTPASPLSADDRGMGAKDATA
ncbi:paraquat-inducible protein A [Acidisoma cellulosilytica]|uniref:Paraquat-inducible protein A n=1 Tax=Acidisoma cellulosilyticum TaxID=2802395 RepID=A0A964E2T8_9PROT|nr:paraquat-inducible protein A [Acidisoma cellulosilyticum]MCB8879659.1 paraquat-inducible protein A [Acidisoma cellulosilyticum]